MSKTNYLAFNPRPLGIFLLIFTFIGILLSIASAIFLPKDNLTSNYIFTHSINFLGDIITLTGSIKFIKKKRSAKLITQIGSIIFGVAGIGFFAESIIGGIVTISFSILFFYLAKKCKI